MRIHLDRPRSSRPDSCRGECAHDPRATRTLESGFSVFAGWRPPRRVEVRVERRLACRAPVGFRTIQRGVDGHQTVVADVRLSTAASMLSSSCPAPTCTAGPSSRRGDTVLFFLAPGQIDHKVHEPYVPDPARRDAVKLCVCDNPNVLPTVTPAEWCDLSAGGQDRHQRAWLRAAAQAEIGRQSPRPLSPITKRVLDDVDLASIAARGAGRARLKAASGVNALPVRTVHRA